MKARSAIAPGQISAGECLLGFLKFHCGEGNFMRQIVPSVLIAIGASFAGGQSQARSTHATRPAAIRPVPSMDKLPPGIPAVKGLVRTAFSLRFEDIREGTGPLAEPYKMYTVQYTGWLAADGRKFDSSYDHRLPVTDKEGKPVMGDDGKAKMGDPQPFVFAQGMGRLIPGFEQGFTGMRVGGKRRLFIPWELAYGDHGVPSRDAAHPGIPPRSDLIFDIELVAVQDLMPASSPAGTGTQGAAAPSASK